MFILKTNNSLPQSITPPPSDTARSIVKKLALSILFGQPGTIQKSGITIAFLKRIDRDQAASRLASLRLFFILVHELGHAFIAKLNNSKSIEITVDDKGGNTHETCESKKTPLMEASFLAAGPLASTTTSLALLGLTLILSKRFPDFLGPLLWIPANWGYGGGLITELCYFFGGIYDYCTKNEGSTDWSKLAANHKAVFAVASALVICQTLLGTAAYYKIFKTIFFNDQAKAQIADRINLVKSLFTKKI